MASREGLRRIGIVHLGSSRWAAATNYIRMLSYSLGYACRTVGMQAFLLSQQDAIYHGNHNLPIKVAPIKSAPHFPGEWRLRRLLGLPDKSDLFHTSYTHGISMLLPLQELNSTPVKSFGIKTIAWIPDFQHVYLPEFFSERERRSRDVSFRGLAQQATLVMLSSQNAMEHFVSFAPEYAHKARVSPFPSLFAFISPEGDSLSIQHKFNLPEKFVLVANQFWRHKNHLVVVDAIRLLRRKGIQIQVVMAGVPADYRDPTNRPLSEVLQTMACGSLTDQITILGMVTDEDLVKLLRTAAVVIQPSRFEGWSTIVQDSKALGRPLICSDIPVHREQVPGANGFFPCDRSDVLADLLANCWRSLEPGPNPAMEEQALAKEREFAREHGRCLLSLCQEAHCN